MTRTTLRTPERLPAIPAFNKAAPACRANGKPEPNHSNAHTLKRLGIGMTPKGEETMHEADVKAVVAAVLAEQKRLHEESIDDVVLKTVVTLLTSFGFEKEDRKELRADFQHLRRWRKSVEQAQSYTFRAAITILVGGFLGALWLGIKTLLGK